MAIVESGDGSFEAEAQATEDAKVAEAKSQLVDEATGGEGSELILGKYGSTEELAKAYQSLQSEYSKLKGERGEVQPQAEPEPEPVAQQEAPPEPPQQEEKGGIDAEKAAKVVEAVFTQTGGQAKYEAITGWAAKSLPEDQIKAFNAALQSGDVSNALNAVKGLQYDYMMATGFEPRITGGRAAAAEVQGFRSEAEAVRAMNDPRYQNGPQQDPAYIDEVMKKMAVSNVFSPR